MIFKAGKFECDAKNLESRLYTDEYGNTKTILYAFLELTTELLDVDEISNKINDGFDGTVTVVKNGKNVEYSKYKITSISYSITESPSTIISLEFSKLKEEK